jgi:uncharacterized membrane protein
MADKTNKPVVVYLATYTSLDDAKADYGAVKQLYSAGIIGTYDAAVISKDTAGKVTIMKTEKPTQLGAWTGLAVGALVGLFFPPYFVWEVAVGAVAGALIGHFWRGLSRSDLKQIGDTLQQSTATLIVIGQSKLQEALRDATKRAVKQFEKELNIDVKSFDKDLTEAVNQFLAQESMPKRRTA